MQSGFSKIRPQRTARLAAPEQATEALFWRKFKKVERVKLHGAVTSIAVNSVTGHYAVTTPHRVQLFDPKNFAKAKRTMSSFKYGCAGARFRSDGRLLAMGQGARAVVYSTDGGNLLRTFRGHTGKVNSVSWARDKVQLLSCSDDMTSRTWDLATNACVAKLHGHTDYVKCSAPSPSTAQVYLTGSYDATVKLWDVRQWSAAAAAGSAAADRPASAALTLAHGSPVESVIWLKQSGSLVASAGGNVVKIWALAAGTAKPVATLSNHQKTITSLWADEAGQRLVSGGLDGFVKIYDLDTYEALHGIKFAAPVLSVALNAARSALIVGTAGGGLVVRRRPKRSEAVASAVTTRNLGRPVASTVAIFDRSGTGAAAKAAAAAAAEEAPRGGTQAFFNRGKRTRPEASDLVSGPKQRKLRLQPHDQMLRKFRYADALDEALATKEPRVVVSVLQELQHRDGVDIALRARDEEELEPIMLFLIRYMTNPRYARELLRTANHVLNLYAHQLGRSGAPSNDQLASRLHRRVTAEIALQQRLGRLLGTIELVQVGAGAAAAVTRAK